MGFFKVLKFHFTTPLHIGTVRSSLDASEKMLHSDTLYAAIVQAWVRLGLPLSELVDADGQPGDFALSSLFPFGGTTLFLPALKHRLRAAQGEKIDHKDLDQVRFVDLDLFKELQLQGHMNVRNTDIQGEYCSRKSLGQTGRAKLMESQVYPRVRVARSGISGANEPYYIERLFFQPGSGLYALGWFENEASLARIRTALNYLGDEGLGTDRHVGNGLYQLEIADSAPAELFQAATPYRMNLSLFLPREAAVLEQMINDREAVFDTLERGGWMTTDAYLNYKKNSIHMFREGSVFRFEDTVAGTTANLRPTQTPRPVDTPVWRTGKSIFIPVKL